MFYFSKNSCQKFIVFIFGRVPHRNNDQTKQRQMFTDVDPKPAGFQYGPDGFDVFDDVVRCVYEESRADTVPRI